MNPSNAVPPLLDLGPRPHLGYTASAIDRAAHYRGDPAKLEQLAGLGSAGFYLIAGELVILKKAADALDPLFSQVQARTMAGRGAAVFLGLANEAPRFGLAVDPATVAGLKLRGDLAVTDLRSIAVQGLVASEHLPPLAEAKALLGWHGRHGFCPNCGVPTRVVQGGWRRDCPACATEHFPRTDPVVIMLAIGGDRCLLGRSPRFAATMWSCLAGFVEPGESLDEAVRREVHEETGVRCGRVNYFASQPWPFPSSLMIGCHAEALSETITIDRSEIEDARWFTREELALMLARRHPDGLTTPPPVAIAHHIIRSYIEEGDNVLG